MNSDLELIKELENEENAEETLITFYQSLLDLGIQHCLPTEHQVTLNNYFKILHDDSHRHLNLVKQIIGNLK